VEEAGGTDHRIQSLGPGRGNRKRQRGVGNNR
jgi:hypothetical protein